MRQYIDIVENDLFEDADTGPAEPFEHTPGAFGEQYVNSQVALVGGIRTRFIPPKGFDRLFYTIISMEEYNRTQNADEATFGTCDLYKNMAGELCGLIDIKLDKNKRKAGIGGMVIRGLLATYGKDFTVMDIRRPAIGFWRKMGCEFYWPNRQPANPNDVKPGKCLMGVIRQGSNTPLEELPGFFKPLSSGADTDK
jgi:hypothetical protein